MGAAQFAAAAVSGVAARAEGCEFGDAVAGLTRIDVPIPDRRKRRLSAVALIDVLLNVLLNVFFISFMNFFIVAAFFAFVMHTIIVTSWTYVVNLTG